MQIWIVVALSTSVLAVILFVQQLKRVKTNNYTYINQKIPPEFDGFKILQISDLHDNLAVIRDGRLNRLVQSEKPDIIVVTGDIVGTLQHTFSHSLSFLREAVQIAPVYYCNGNHESRVPQYLQLKHELQALGIHLLINRAESVGRNNRRIYIYGVDDPRFISEQPEDAHKILKSHLSHLPPADPRDFNILLAHRPHHFEMYARYNYDLIFCGHAHGGQFRLPFVGGLYAPQQGLFPEYTSGFYQSGNSSMMVSRGLGNSVMHLRINNPFEIVCVTLRAARK